MERVAEGETRPCFTWQVSWENCCEILLNQIPWIPLLHSHQTFHSLISIRETNITSLIKRLGIHLNNTVQCSTRVYVTLNTSEHHISLQKNLQQKEKLRVYQFDWANFYKLVAHERNVSRIQFKWSPNQPQEFPSQRKWLRLKQGVHNFSPPSHHEPKGVSHKFKLLHFSNQHAHGSTTLHLHRTPSISKQTMGKKNCKKALTKPVSEMNDFSVFRKPLFRRKSTTSWSKLTEEAMTVITRARAARKISKGEKGPHLHSIKQQLQTLLSFSAEEAPNPKRIRVWRPWP